MRRWRRTCASRFASSHAPGKSDDDIRAYLVARYGDFVLYDPPLKRTTWLLWLGPFVLLVGGGALWWAILTRRTLVSDAAAAANPVARARGRELLDDGDKGNIAA